MERGVALGLIFASIVIANDGRADVAACAAAAEHGQDFARAGKLMAAREAFATCASTDCPDLIAHDCANWLASTDARVASAVVSVTDSKGAKVEAAIVQMDGAPIQWTSQTPIHVDPGVHTFVVRNDGDATVERNVTFAEGATVPVDVQMTPVLAETPSPEPVHRGKSKPLLFGALGASGVAVAGFALFAGFGEAGLSQQSDLRTSCAPHCASNQVDPVSTKFAIANVSAVVGIVAALGAGALWYLFARSDHAEAPPVTSAR